MSGWVTIGEALEASIRARGKRPCCVKCGKPDVLMFAGDPCQHELPRKEAKVHG